MVMASPATFRSLSPYKPTYDLKTKKKSLDEARAALQDFASFVQTRPTAEALAERFDVPGFIKAQAMEVVLGAVDHYVRVANNYYLYFNEPTGRWIYIPTDFDYTMIDVTGPNCAVNTFLPICQQTLNVEGIY
jgi:spore coat protein CotH